MKSAITIPALVLVDTQEGFHEPYWGIRNNDYFEKNVTALLNHWRKINGKVFHVQHLSRERLSPLRPDQPGVEFMDFAKPLSHEPIFQKSVNSAFIGTSLESSLRASGQNRLLFIGLTTDHCVSTSVRMAANLGFEVEVSSDATATFNRIGSDGTLYLAELVHEVSLASLNKEFARVRSTQEIISAYPDSEPRYRRSLQPG